MTAILNRSEESAALFFCIKSLLSLLIMPVCTSKQKQAISEHVTWMEAQIDPLVDCQLETFPERKETKLTISIRYQPRGDEHVH